MDIVNCFSKKQIQNMDDFDQKHLEGIQYGYFTMPSSALFYDSDSKPEHQKEIDQINISLNPYHGIMEKANEYKNKGDIASYERMKKVYVNNIANALYTCTPLIDNDCYQILIKAADSSQDDCFKDYDQEVCINLIKEIMKALFDRYLLDIQNNNYKYAKTFEEAELLVSKQVEKFSTLLTT